MNLFINKLFKYLYVKYINFKFKKILSMEPVSQPELDTVEFKLNSISESLTPMLEDSIFGNAYDPALDNLHSFCGPEYGVGSSLYWQGRYLTYLSLKGDIGKINSVLMETVIPLCNVGGPGILSDGTVTNTCPNDPQVVTIDNVDYWDNCSLESLVSILYGLASTLIHPESNKHIDKGLIRTVASRIVSTLIANNYTVIRPSGRVSSAGSLSPRLGRSPYRLLILLLALRLAEHKNYTSVFNDNNLVLEYGAMGWPGTGSDVHLLYDALISLAPSKEYLAGLRNLRKACSSTCLPCGVASILSRHGYLSPQEQAIFAKSMMDITPSVDDNGYVLEFLISHLTVKL